MKTLNFGKSGASSGGLDLTKGAADDGSPTDHTHPNKALIDRLGEDPAGTLTLDGIGVDTVIPMRAVYDALDSTDATISLSANMGRVLDEKIAVNAGDINDNSAAITINAGNISDNTTDIGNNAAAITTNAGNISDNSDRLDVLEPLSHSHANKTILDGVLTNRIMTWQGEWQNRAYLLDNLVRDGGWTMVANKDTADRAAPQPSGDPIADLPEEPGFTQKSNSGEVVSTHDYTLLEGGWLQVLEVRVPEVGANVRNSLIMSNITDPANPVHERVNLENLRANEWNKIKVVNKAFASGTKIKLQLESQNIGAVSTVTGGWGFTGTDNSNPPATSSWNINTQDTTLRIDKIDADLTDRSTELNGIIAGSDVQFVDTLNTNLSVTYRVHTVADMGSFVQYDVTRVTQGVSGIPPAGATTTMNAEIPVAELTKYYEKPLNWSANPVTWATVVGELTLDGVVQNLPDSAFGIRLTFQAAYISPDWDVVSVSDTVGSGGGTVAGDMYKADYDTDDNGRVDDSDLVNGLTVETAVPPGALFTDTIYDDSALDGRVTQNEQDIDALEAIHANPQNYESQPTGLIDGGELNIVIGTNVEVIAGIGIIVDSYTTPDATPLVTDLSWATQDIAIINIAPVAGDLVFILINPTGTLIQVETVPTPQVVRDNIYLGYLIYDGSTWGEVSAPIVVNNSATSLAEYIKTVAGPTFKMTGGEVLESGLFNMDKTAGTVWEMNRNWHVNKKDPHRESFAAQPAFTFRYTNRDFSVVSAPTNTIDPTLWDNAGVIEAITGSAQNTAIQRLYIDQRDNLWVMYGQQIHDNFREAVARIGVDQSGVEIPSLLGNAVFLGYIISERSRVEWEVEKAKFVSVQVAIGGGASTPVQNFIDLNDTPAAYVGQAGRVTKVAPDELSLIFADDAAEVKAKILAGIDDKANTTFTYDGATNTATVTPTGTDFEVYTFGNRFIFNSPQSVVLDPAIKHNMVVFDSNGVLAGIDEDLLNQDEAQLKGVAIIGRVTHDTVSQTLLIAMDLRYPYDMNPSTRESFIHIDGVQFRAGFQLQNLVVDGDGSTDNQLQVGVEPGQLFLANSTYASQLVPQPLAFPAQIAIVYRYNDVSKVKTADTFPIIQPGSVGADYDGVRLAHNTRDEATDIGDLVETRNGYFVNYHYFIMMGTDSTVVIVPGIKDYVTKNDAAQNASTEIDTIMTDLASFKYYSPIGTVIYEANDSFTNVAKARIVSINVDEDYIDFRNAKQLFGTDVSSNAGGSFHQDAFNVYNDNGNKVTFNADTINDGEGQGNSVEIKAYGNMDLMLVPEYNLTRNASTALTDGQEVSMNINGDIQGYPATGGASNTDFTERSVIHHNMVFVSGATGIVAYTDATANALFLKPGVAQANGSVIWGTELLITTNGDVSRIRSCQIDATYVNFTWFAGTGMQSVIVNTNGTTVSLGGIVTPRDADNVSFGDVAYDSAQNKIVWAWRETDNYVYNNYGKVSGNSMDVDDYAAQSGQDPGGTTLDLEITSEGNNIICSYHKSDNVLQLMEMNWYKPTFSTGRYDDNTNVLTVVSGISQLCGVAVYGGTIRCQTKISGLFNTYYASYSSGGTINPANQAGGSLSGEAAKTMESDSGLAYNVIYSTGERIEVWELSLGDMATGWEKIFTGAAAIPSTAAVEEVYAVIFGATFAVLLKGDTVIRDTIDFIDSNATRTDNYIGNAMGAANPGDQVTVLMGLPIINHPIIHAPGAVFHNGPYKYQAISKHQVVMIVEETIFP